MKFCKYSTGDSVMRHKTIDKSQKNSNIGAGPMGLAVAYQLVKDGYKPVVYEADDRIGGMTASFYFDGLE
jgi:NADPH-dependent glutamate synthase beta subunit-like oxidoreductase